MLAATRGQGHINENNLVRVLSWWESGLTSPGVGRSAPPVYPPSAWRRCGTPSPTAGQLQEHSQGTCAVSLHHQRRIQAQNLNHNSKNKTLPALQELLKESAQLGHANP
jgi:hypothetical protein